MPLWSEGDPVWGQLISAGGIFSLPSKSAGDSVVCRSPDCSPIESFSGNDKLLSAVHSTLRSNPGASVEIPAQGS